MTAWRAGSRAGRLAGFAASGAACEPAATPMAAPRPAIDDEAVAGPPAEQPARSAQAPSAAPAARSPGVARRPFTWEVAGRCRDADMPIGRPGADTWFPLDDHDLASAPGPVPGGTSRRMQTRSE